MYMDYISWVYLNAFCAKYKINFNNDYTKKSQFMSRRCLYYDDFLSYSHDGAIRLYDAS